MKPVLLAAAGLLAATTCSAAPLGVDDYMGQPQVKAAARIAYGAAPAQVVDLFLPEGKGPHPVVVLIHGGCFLAQYKGLGETSGVAADLARRGYAVWNVEYRKLGEPGGGWPGTLSDVAAAVDRLAADAPKYGLDPRRVVALGHSAGGHLALWAAARGRLPRSSVLWRPHPQPIRAVVSVGGIGDLKGQGGVFAGACGPEPIPAVIGLAQRGEAAYADTSPAALLPSGTRSVMISGQFDHVMPPDTGRAYVAKVRAAGDAGEAVEIPGVGHFDPMIPTTAAWREVADRVAAEIGRLR